MFLAVRLILLAYILAIERSRRRAASLRRQARAPSDKRCIDDVTSMTVRGAAAALSRFDLIRAVGSSQARPIFPRKA